MRYIAIEEKQIKQLKREAQQYQDDITCAVGTDFMQKIAEAENKTIFEIIKTIEEAPTEDVVPRAEVKQRYQIRADGTLEMIPTVESVRQQVAREIFDLIDNYIYIVKTTVSFDLDFLITSIAELKKKNIGE